MDSGKYITRRTSVHNVHGSQMHLKKLWNSLNLDQRRKSLQYKWQPHDCTFDSSFDAFIFLNLLKGKHLLFVGDSITYQHFMSLYIMLGAEVQETHALNTKQFEGHHWNFAKRFRIDKCENDRQGIERWHCCEATCRSFVCCRTIRQFYAARTNTTFSFHETNLPIDVGLEKANLNPDAYQTDCLIAAQHQEVLDWKGCQNVPWVVISGGGKHAY